MTATTSTRPLPTDPDVCSWTIEATGENVTVHLWGGVETGMDSRTFESWQFRRCLVCRKIDREYLLQEHAAKDAS